MTQAMSRDLRRNSELVAELTPFFPTFTPDFFGFFNFRTGNFFGFSNFEPEKIRPKKFRGKNDPAVQLSGRTFLAGKIFVPYERNVIGRNFSGGMLPLRCETRGYERFFRLSRRSFWNFWARKPVQRNNFRHESIHAEKGSCFQGVPSGDFFKSVLHCHQTFPQKVCSWQRTFL
ncbi:MAG: hypothetical protein ACLQMU_00530 [Methanoregula sp.]|uniref:hypothetical protein n=1 Tax=Methanoregula sp. TaxID=2052170 RepID=UPI003FD7D1F9